MTEIVPSSSTGKSGNTKQISPAKHWCFTLNNFTLDDIDIIKNLNSSIVPNLRFQEEVGEEGTPHLQGVLSLASKGRPKSLIPIERIHWEKCRNLLASIEYCWKASSAVQDGARYNRGYKLPPKPVVTLEENQLRDWQKEIVKIIEEDPDNRSIFWYYGATNIGKTTFCKYLSVKFGAIPLSGKGGDMRNGVIQYKEKNGDTPACVLIPIPKTFSMEYLSYEGIEQVKDMYFYSGKYEGGAVVGNCPHVFVFANEPPDTSKLAQDRWIIRELHSF